MSRDPFEILEEQNPMPEDRPVYTPMDTAEKIIGKPHRRPWPGWALAGAAAAAVLIAGGAWLWWMGGDDGIEVADSSMVPVVSDSTTTTDTATDVTETTVAFEQTDGVVYFFLDDTADPETCPTLVPVHRVVDSNAPVESTLQALLDGPTSDEAASVPALSSAIPQGTRLLGIDVANGHATVDLSSEFLRKTPGEYSTDFYPQETTRSCEGAAGYPLGQVVFTLTRLPDIDSVIFLVEGEETGFVANPDLPVIVGSPLARHDVEYLLPAVMIETPVYGGSAGNPVVVAGTANVFEAVVSLALVDNDGLILWESTTMASCGTGCRGDFEISIPYDLTQAQLGAIIAWEASAMDGSQTNVREHPVWLSASSSTDTCSGALAGSFVEQPDLPTAVADIRRQMWQAAIVCDYETLAALASPNVNYSFGDSGDPAAYWTQLETDGEQPMLYLAATLNLPSATIDAGDLGTVYVWPSAYSYPSWNDVPQADRDALAALYHEADVADWELFGSFIGWRIGITGNGEWVYFVAGD
jgi:spore germination protein GerM